MVIGWDMADDVIAVGTLGYGSEHLSCSVAESCSAIDNDVIELYC